MTSARKFWLFWLGGAAVFAVMVVMNPWLVTDAAPEGIPSHQKAGTAAVADAIHASWKAADVMGLAKLCVALDLVFIALYSIGGVIAGARVRQSDIAGAVMMGFIISLSYIVFAVTDYGETIAQALQLYGDQGSNVLAGFALAIRPAKMISFVVGTIAVLIAIFVYKIGKSESV